MPSGIAGLGRGEGLEVACTGAAQAHMASVRVTLSWASPRAVSAHRMEGIWSGYSSSRSSSRRDLRTTAQILSHWVISNG